MLEPSFRLEAMLRKRYWATAGLLVAATLILLIVRFTAANGHLDAAMAGSAAPSHEFAAQSASQKSSAPLRISAARLYAEYDENAVAANDEFAGRTLAVSGKILSADQEAGHTINLRIGVDQYGFNNIDARVSEDTDTHLRKGDSVTVVCTDVHRSQGSLTLDHCSLAPVN